MGKLSEAKKEANKRYNAKTYDKITFTVKKGKKDCIKRCYTSYWGELKRFL